MRGCSQAPRGEDTVERHVSEEHVLCAPRAPGASEPEKHGSRKAGSGRTVRAPAPTPSSLHSALQQQEDPKVPEKDWVLRGKKTTTLAATKNGGKVPSEGNAKGPHLLRGRQAPSCRDAGIPPDGVHYARPPNRKRSSGKGAFSRLTHEGVRRPLGLGSKYTFKTHPQRRKD